MRVSIVLPDGSGRVQLEVHPDIYGLEGERLESARGALATALLLDPETLEPLPVPAIERAVAEIWRR